MVLNDRNYSYSSYHTLNDKAHEIFAKKKKSPNLNLQNFHEFKTFLGLSGMMIWAYHIPKAAIAARAIARRQLQHIEPFDFD